MKQYRCYFLNGASRIIGAHVFYCDNGTAALHEARLHLDDHECRAAAEVWHEEDYVGCVMRSDAVGQDHAVSNDAIGHDHPAKCPLLRKAS